MATGNTGISEPTLLEETRETCRWDVKPYHVDRGGRLSSPFRREPLAAHIVEEKKKESPSRSPQEEYAVLGVDNKKGMVDRYIQDGKDVTPLYKVVEDGFLAYNPYRVNIGSVGLKTVERKHRHISPSYVVFRCRRRLRPEFLFILFKTHRFIQLIHRFTTGSVRETLSFKQLSQIRVPVPGIDTQERLVGIYNESLRRVKGVETRASALEKKIETYLIKELGLEAVLLVERECVNPMLLDDTEEWAVNYNLNRHILEAGCRSKYPLIPCGDFVESFRYGISETASKEKTTDAVPMLRMNNIFKSELVPDDLKYIEKSLMGTVPLLEPGDLLFNRTNSKELVGKTAVFDVEGDYTFASYLIRVRVAKERADVHFINYLFNSVFMRKQVAVVSRQAQCQANINIKELKAFLVPLPPLEVQERIVSTMNRLRERLKRLRCEAESLRKEALTSFENALFSR